MRRNVVPCSEFSGTELKHWMQEIVDPRGEQRRGMQGLREIQRILGVFYSSRNTGIYRVVEGVLVLEGNASDSF